MPKIELAIAQKGHRWNVLVTAVGLSLVTHICCGLLLGWVDLVHPSIVSTKNSKVEVAWVGVSGILAQGGELSAAGQEESLPSTGEVIVKQSENDIPARVPHVKKREKRPPTQQAPAAAQSDLGSSVAGQGSTKGMGDSQKIGMKGALGASQAGSSPQVLGNRKPEYPAIARQRKQEGEVLLQVTVSSLGLPEKIIIERSSGYSLLDQAAVKSVTQWRFTPARDAEGVAMPAQVLLPISFRLQ